MDLPNVESRRSQRTRCKAKTPLVGSDIGDLDFISPTRAGAAAMMTFSYRIIFNDSEMIAVEAALKHYRSICEAKLAEEAGAPYWAHRRAIDAVVGRLLADRQMMSTNNFRGCRPGMAELNEG
jgi:hypothetical protein